MPEQHTIVGDAYQHQAVTVLPCPTPCSYVWPLMSQNLANPPIPRMACPNFCAASSRAEDRGRERIHVRCQLRSVTKRKRLSGDEQIIGADRFAGSF